VVVLGSTLESEGGPQDHNTLLVVILCCFTKCAQKARKGALKIHFVRGCMLVELTTPHETRLGSHVAELKHGIENHTCL
jgi:hypothetical protein